ncbi:hypothetical protein DFH05DRAFT_1476764 [Lentinula detonsa]|uniref:Cytochrome c domain-containing protein n=1 Tax=Lentinula detonsa TaxID=2804962 RepID=A0A9W8U1Y7_9AGAR|nr:hypothetical protein DFH05DRAFT_1476764 [Lentinula detonsa]
MRFDLLKPTAFCLLVFGLLPLVYAVPRPVIHERRGGCMSCHTTAERTNNPHSDTSSNSSAVTFHTAAEEQPLVNVTLIFVSMQRWRQFLFPPPWDEPEIQISLDSMLA